MAILLLIFFASDLSKTVQKSQKKSKISMKYPLAIAVAFENFLGLF
jgi:hypothetical protein